MTIVAMPASPASPAGSFSDSLEFADVAGPVITIKETRGV